ncbi:NAP1-related protein 2 [Castilleja foliolosa]|uniref:NAP1-related protein 2 n=1 Tax=Castilleja foliolosa TaxID=1961234 RepID=A0ABD3DA49_9LAMI
MYIFKYLNNLEVEDSKDVKSGYSIAFKFKPNPYFEDTKISKTYTFLEEGITKITVTPIKWKEGKGTPNVLAEEKKGNKRSHVEEIFFTWFSDSEHKGDIFEIHDEDLLPNPLTYFNNDADEEELEMDDEDDDEENGDDESEDDDDKDED